VVEDERSLGHGVEQREGSAVLMRSDEHVEHQAGGGHGTDPADDLGPGEPIRVRFVVRLVADADQTGAGRPVPAGPRDQCGDAVDDVRSGQVHPADDPGDRLGLLEEPGGLAGVVHGLHDDRPGDVGAPGGGAEVVHVEPAADRSDRVVHPGVRPVGGIPEVVVSVDDHALMMPDSSDVRSGCRRGDLSRSATPHAPQCP